MFVLDSVNCGDAYTDAATISNVFNSSGGYFAITGNDAYARLIYGRRGQLLETAEFHVPSGNGILYPGTVGIKVRNYTAGSVAVVSAALSLPSEPSVALSAGGIASPPIPPVSSMITGQVELTGAVIAGTGFTAVRNGPGSYTVTFTTAFATPPDVLVTPGNLAALFHTVPLPVLAGSFNVFCWNLAGANVDGRFGFIATAMV